MLVLTRKSNQSIMIGDDIEVSVLSIMGEKVRIGIQAPRDIPVFRREVYLEIQEERGAARADPPRSPSAPPRPTTGRRQPITRNSSWNIASVTPTAVASSTRTRATKRSEPCRCRRSR